MRNIDGIVLAGGSPGKGEILGATTEALLPVGGRPMVTWVLRALQDSGCIERLVLVGPPELSTLAEEEGVYWVLAGSSAVESALNGYRALEGSRWLLLATADLPLLTPQAVRDFLERCLKVEADLYYPIITRQSVEEKFGGARRTYVRLKEGTFTGGNLALMRADALMPCALQGEKLVKLRKSPLGLARQIGLLFILKFILGRLTLAEVERNFSHLLGVRGVAIITPYPEIGMDVDKREDWELVRRVFDSATFLGGG
ncbi:MobA-like NTP transferase domain-containing protein [Thermanaeromonas toyohensis ToBE]|uniref:MobA-like NTP transferase domain-containing protein n=1 Tax=Thermanaeromonas toyohensis ToBE TaxID=698762 RepID=A0A1W1V7Q4_9FIRM|nr:nucleotidyltransferase family protein [Thermanaeromonas toyohensis]SMB89449.1 MobA-like NTP transferase domain-containing protein [Thermanaeromonas toyohensis ToBE]